MKNILFLGTSHVGTLKAGFRLITSEEGNNICPDFCQVNFAGFKGRLFDNFCLNSNLDLVPNDRNEFKHVSHDLEFNENQNCIQLGKFDLIAIVQGPSPFYPFLYFGDNGSASILSSALIKSICTSPWTSDHNSRLSGKWREFDRFTYISPCVADILKSQELKTVYIGTPVPSKRCLRHMGRNSLNFDAYDLKKWNSIFNQIWSICDGVNSRGNEFSSQVYLPCSEIIDKNRLYSRNHFFKSAVTISGEGRGSDGWHANAKYGSIVISDFLKKVSTFF